MLILQDVNWAALHPSPHACVLSLRPSAYGCTFMYNPASGVDSHSAARCPANGTCVFNYASTLSK